MDQSALPALLSVDEVTAYLRVSERWVYDQLRSGTIPSVRIARQFRVRATDLEAYLESQKTLAPTGG